ncbi:telomeric repeat-binding factor 2-interacting protein 1 [Electrophorus electricus]|uniref:telomeric repeat-binding factor 2-interacting protein 1 n=1 Tax=Electrophorus electricus TaxID=8005 RepID=UPI0015CFA8C7|nr:telomeric repeat-binding factor 2-interacting protein 1 [Electrophorus electricus]XP_035376472.1 telomeric repeat-binding factor 2-interacting protein 1 [Electrophorus electricus]
MSVVKGDSSDTSPVLFLNTKGEPMRFYIRPGPTKIQLQPLITRSGGVLCRTQESSAILLADPGETSIAMERARQFYISTQYIHDCVVQNQQLDIENYRFSNLQPALTRATARKHRGQGRMCYSLEDDAAIINFIAKCRHEVKGNRVWQQMERQGITTHSWQSMKDRFLKHLQYKISDKSPVRKPKKIPIEESSSSEHNISQTSPEPHMLKKTPNKALITSSSDSDTTQVTPDVLGLTEGRAADHTPPRSSPRKRNAQQCPGSGKDKPYPPSDVVKETLKGDKPDQECLPEELQDQQDSEQPEISPKRARGDKDATGGNASGPEDQLVTPRKIRQKNPESATCSEKKLGILERAAREFEDSQSDNGSLEDSDSDECQIMAAREMAVGDQQVDIQHPKDGEPHLPAPSKGKGTQGHEDNDPGPSTAAIPITSNVHMFLFDQESQEDLTQLSQEEGLSKDLLEAKQHVVNLMQESEKDLVEVMKALLKASGDVSLALTYLLGGYDRNVHRPIWTRQDDEKLLSCDSSALPQLQEKYGAQGISKRQAFLKAM